ncbi:hypothetical protein D918_05229 [Trichuris suis]|nr:hypothetical protein D918_05229 [Trichuris suis]
MARYDGIEYGYRPVGKTSFNNLLAAGRQKGFNEVVRRRILAGNFFLLKRNCKYFYEKAARIRRLITEEYKRVYSAGVDVLLLPATQGDAPLYSHYVVEDVQYTRERQDDFFTQPANLAGTIQFVIYASQFPYSDGERNVMMNHSFSKDFYSIEFSDCTVDVPGKFQRRGLCDENNEEFNGLLLHTEIRWLSKGACLWRFFQLFDSVLQFFEEDDASLTANLRIRKADVAYLADPYFMFNEMNKQLLTEDLSLIKTKSVISAFMSKLLLFKRRFAMGELCQFQNLIEVKKEGQVSDADVEVYREHLQALHNDFASRFEDILSVVIPETGLSTRLLASRTKKSPCS